VTATVEREKHLGSRARPRGGRLRRRLRMSRTNIALTLVMVGAILAWEIAARLDLVDALFVSYPSAIIAQVPELAGEERVRTALATTGMAMFWAFVYGTLAGIVLGYLMGFFRVFRDAFYGPALFLMSVPKSIFIPIFMVFFGINIQTAIYYGAFSGFIYVLINVVGGFDLIQERHQRVARAYGASLRHRILDVVLPASLPGVFTGIWYGIKNGLQGVLIFELFVSVGGLGQTITFYTNALRTDRVFALIIGVSVVAILAGSAWTAIEKRLSRWRPETRMATATEQPAP
jgi:ABC-type nitrate/sulfonate/bicarbonate transport system permease component